MYQTDDSEEQGLIQDLLNGASGFSEWLSKRHYKKMPNKKGTALVGYATNLSIV